MDTLAYAGAIIRELQQAADTLSEGQGESAEQLTAAIMESGKVFVAGAGRSGLMGKAFAMRLMHLGVEAYVVGETVTPGLGRGDLLIIGSGSGETKSLVGIAEKAKKLEAGIALVTINPESTIGQLSDIVVTLPGATKDAKDASRTQTIQPMGSLFEQTLLLMYDAIILRLMEKQGLDSAAMYGRHANLE